MADLCSNYACPNLRAEGRDWCSECGEPWSADVEAARRADMLRLAQLGARVLEILMETPFDAESIGVSCRAAAIDADLFVPPAARTLGLLGEEAPRAR